MPIEDNIRQQPPVSIPKESLGKNEKFSIRVLLAEDEEMVRVMTTLALEGMGCTVESVENGEQFLARLETSKPGEFGLLMTDKIMGKGKKNGMEVLNTIHADARFNKLPGILYSGNSDEEIEDEAALNKLGYAYIAKPFELEKLRTTIKNLLAESKERS